MFCMALLLVIIAWGGLIPEIALSQQQQSRLNAVESDVYRIESRLNRIEAQLNQLSRSESPGAPINPLPSPKNPGQNPPQLNREQMFDRLATLVIELREQIKELQARVSKLERRSRASAIATPAIAIGSGKHGRGTKQVQMPLHSKKLPMLISLRQKRLLIGRIWSTPLTICWNRRHAPG